MRTWHIHPCDIRWCLKAALSSKALQCSVVEVQGRYTYPQRAIQPFICLALGKSLSICFTVMNNSVQHSTGKRKQKMPALVTAGQNWKAQQTAWAHRFSDASASVQHLQVLHPPASNLGLVKMRRWEQQRKPCSCLIFSYSWPQWKENLYSWAIVPCTLSQLLSTAFRLSLLPLLIIPGFGFSYECLRAGAPASFREGSLASTNFTKHQDQ